MTVTRWRKVLGNIRLLGPDTPKFREDVRFIYDHIENLEGHKQITWMIQPRDQRWDGQGASIVLEDEWELFGVTAVPNTTDPDQMRFWLRRPTDWKKSKPYEVRIASAGWGGHQVLLHLSDHWTPFAMSDSYGNHIVWFLRRV